MADKDMWFKADDLTRAELRRRGDAGGYAHPGMLVREWVEQILAGKLVLATAEMADVQASAAAAEAKLAEAQARSTTDGRRLRAEVERLTARVAELEATSASSPTLDAACAVLIQHIDRDQAELILDLCRDTGHAPADYILGYLELIRDRQETAMLFGPERAVDTAVAKPVLAREESRPCEFCAQEFKVERRGQRFCPAPADQSESCGRKAFLKDLHERRPQRSRQEKAASPMPDYSPPQVDPVQMRRILVQQSEAARAMEG